MTLHGHTRIELTDVHTGAVEVVESDNLITNAVSDIFNGYGGSLNKAMLLWRGITYYLNILVGASFSLKMGLTGKKADEIEAEIAKEKSEQ